MRFGYDGAGFSGWARQPRERTVEGEIRRALPRMGIVPTAEAAHLAVASRTDRGVHARANALALDAPFGGPSLLRALNGVAPDLFFTHIRPVPDAFNPRRAVARSYRYFEPAEGRSLERWRRLLARFVGEVDVRSFGRAVPAAAPVFREVLGASARREGPLLLVDLRARSFVWGMVRKIVAGVRAVDSGDLEEARLEEAIDGRRRITLPLAEPDRLVLWDVEYEEAFPAPAPRPSTRRVRRARDAERAVTVRAAVVHALAAAVLDPS